MDVYKVETKSRGDYDAGTYEVELPVEDNPNHFTETRGVVEFKESFAGYEARVTYYGEREGSKRERSKHFFTVTDGLGDCGKPSSENAARLFDAAREAVRFAAA